MEKTYNVLIVGAGRIGAFLDAPQTQSILTHAHAYSNNKKFKLEGFADPDRDRREQAAGIWKCAAFSSVEEAFAIKKAFDVVCVAAPDDAHFEILMGLAKHPLKIVVSEKPLCKKLSEALMLRQVYSHNNTPILLNYTRRFIPEYSVLKNRIEAGEFGSFIEGSGLYSKGFLHNASHMIDLLRFLIGEVSYEAVFDQVHDFSDADPSFSCILRIGRHSPFIIQAIDQQFYSLFECDLLFQKARVLVKERGSIIEIYRLSEDAKFPGYVALALTERMVVSFDHVLAACAENVCEYLESGMPLKCTLEEGVKLAELYDTIPFYSEK